MARAEIEKGKMDPQEEESIQTFIMEIEDLVEAKELTPKLFSHFIISREDKEKIEAGETRRERTKRLLNILVCRGQHAFPIFVQALEANGYKGLALKLYNNSGQLDGSISSEEEDVSEKFESLSQRIKTIENDVKMKLMTKTDHAGLSVEIKSLSLKMQGLSSTLQKIEDLSIASKDTETTIANLRQQVEEKDKLLQCARERIDELESKLENLEADNALLRNDLKRQDKQIRALRRDVEDEKFRGERIQKQAGEERKKNEAMFEMHEKMIEKMLKEQQAGMEKIQSLEKKIEGNEKQKKNTVKKAIFPRNRIQEYRITGSNVYNRK